MLSYLIFIVDRTQTLRFLFKFLSPRLPGCPLEIMPSTTDSLIVYLVQVVFV